MRQSIMARKALVISTALICIVVAGQSPATSPTVATPPPTSSPPVAAPVPTPPPPPAAPTPAPVSSVPAPAPSGPTGSPAPSPLGPPSASDQNGASPVGSLQKISGCFVLGWVWLYLLL